MFKYLFFTCLFTVHSVSFASAGQTLYKSSPEKGFISDSQVSSNDGFLAYMLGSSDNTTQSLRLVNLATKQEARFQLDVDPWVVRFTPDSKWLIYVTDDGLHFISTKNLGLDHSVALAIDTDIRVSAFGSLFFDISKDSTKVVVSNKKSILVYDVVTGAEVYDSGPLDVYHSVKFFNHSNNISAFTLTTAKNSFSQHYIVDLASRRLFNTCLSDNCFQHVTDIDFGYSISADDNYIVFTTAMDCGRVCTSKLQSYKISEAKVSTIYSMDFPNIGGADGALNFDFDPEDNNLGFWTQVRGDNGGYLTLYSQPSPNLEREMTESIADVSIFHTQPTYFLPRLNEYITLPAGEVNVCAPKEGCATKMTFNSQNTYWALLIAKRTGLLASGLTDKSGKMKMQIINLTTGKIVFEVQDNSLVKEGPSFSHDEKILIMKGYGSQDEDTSYIQIVGLN
jgi:hypothetical protein